MNCMQKSPLELLRSGTAKDSLGGRIRRKRKKTSVVRNQIVEPI